MVALKSGSNRACEIKALAINGVNPHQLAIAAAQPYVRVYDRRMISPQGPLADAPRPVLKLKPPHMPSGANAGR